MMITQTKPKEQISGWLEGLFTPKPLQYVGLIGCQSSGKDYVGGYIRNHIGRPAQVVKFATKLTEMTAGILGVEDLSLFQDREWKEREQFIWQHKVVSARDVQKIIGDLCRDLFGEDVWINALAKECDDPSVLYIVTDLRFQNELDFIHDNNGIVVHVDNREAAQAQHRKEKGNPHKSERLVWNMHYGVVKPDYNLDNNDWTTTATLDKLVTFIREYHQ